jgi:hypothetical protein
MYFAKKVKGYNFVGNDRATYTFTASPNTIIAVYPFSSLLRSGKIQTISTSLSTAGAGTGIEARVGLYQLNNGKDLNDGAVKIDEVVINVGSTATFTLNNFLSKIESMEEFAFGLGITGSYTTYPAMRAIPGINFDTLQQRQKFFIRTNSYVPSSVQISDDIHTGTNYICFAPMFFLDIR